MLNTSGTTSDLISRKKIVDSGSRVTAVAGNSQPIAVPATIEMAIHSVSVGQRLKRAGMRAIRSGMSPRVLPSGNVATELQGCEIQPGDGDR